MRKERNICCKQSSQLATRSLKDPVHSPRKLSDAIAQLEGVSSIGLEREFPCFHRACPLLSTLNASLVELDKGCLRIGTDQERVGLVSTSKKLRHGLGLSDATFDFKCVAARPDAYLEANLGCFNGGNAVSVLYNGRANS